MSVYCCVMLVVHNGNSLTVTVCGVCFVCCGCRLKISGTTEFEEESYLLFVCSFCTQHSFCTVQSCVLLLTFYLLFYLFISELNGIQLACYPNAVLTPKKTKHGQVKFYFALQDSHQKIQLVEKKYYRKVDFEHEKHVLNKVGCVFVFCLWQKHTITESLYNQ